MVAPVVKKRIESTAKDTTFKPSAYQSAIFDAAMKGDSHLAIEAVAGSGKSKTFVELSKLFPASLDVLFCAFNKHIADELSRKLPRTVSVKTIHALGFAAVAKHLGKVKVDSYKYADLVSDKAIATIDQHPYECSDRLNDLTSVLSDMLRFCQSTLVNLDSESELQDVCSHYGVDVQGFDFSLLCESIREIISAGERLAIENRKIDFIDMIYLPIKWDLSLPTYDRVLVDESQDLSKCQLEIVLKCCHKNTKVIAVGDRSQSLYGFAGADNASFQNIVDRLNAKQLPLSICYRCPTSHLDMARSIVPQIEAAPNAIEGSIHSCYDFQLVEKVQAGDFVLSRTTAPLVSQCIKMIGARVPAKVIGRDISKSLTKLVKDIAKQKGFIFSDFPEFVQSYSDKRLQKIQQKKNSESEAQSFTDKIEGILAAYEGFSDCSTVESFCKSIESLFSDDKATVTLCTVHRAKGLEGDRVFILNPEKMPLVWKNQQPWELTQEMNLKYVALTRSKAYLCFVYPSK